MAELPGWLDPAWRQLNRARRQERLPHALLIAGAQGVGKYTLASRLAGALLCEEPDERGKACGRCAACGWLRAGTHPDLMEICPEEPGKALKVDQIRSLSRELGMMSHAGRFKIAIVQPAEAMNLNAANSLLKTLEEPTDNTVLVLLSASPGRLPATVRSRCQKVVLALPDVQASLNWLIGEGLDAEAAKRGLHLAKGAPLLALQIVRSDITGLYDNCLTQLLHISTRKLDPLAVARDWAGINQREILQWWRTWLQDAVRWQMAEQSPQESTVARMLQQTAKTVDCRQIFDLLDEIDRALNNIGSGLNQQLMLEDLLIKWANMASYISKDQLAGGR